MKWYKDNHGFSRTMKWVPIKSSRNTWRGEKLKYSLGFIVEPLVPATTTTNH